VSKPSWIGATLKGRYRIEELLGQGGMSAVYKASDPNLKRVVAVKLIHAHLAGNPQFVTRFEEEAAAVAKLRHPNIVQVYDFDHDDDTYYMILEFVPGETLNDRLKRLNQAQRQLPLAEALQMLSQVCDAVDYAHKRGLVHRDIKPANIMLDVQGHAILMDFGIVKIVGGEKHTSTGAVLGTALYMSPEQIKGEAAEARSDIYSLGVTLFEMLSGKPPFQADSVMTIMMMHLTDPVPDINDLRPNVPADVMAIIQKAMAKQPQDRYQSAAEMAQVLREALGRIKTDQVAAIHPDDKSTFVEDNSTLLDVAAPPPRPAVILPKAQPKPAQPQVDQGQTVHDTGPMPALPRAAQSSPQKVVSNPQPAATQSASHPVAYPSSTVAGSYTNGGQTPARKAQQPASAPKALPWLLILGGGVGVFAILAVIVLAVLISANRNGGGTTRAALSAQASQTAIALAAAQIETVIPSSTATLAPTSAASATVVPSSTATIALTPSDTPPPSQTPTETVPPGILYVRINRITINDQNQYVVEYETFEYTEKLPGTHVHFFFNTVSPEQAGRPGSGPWILYGGPRPFTEYSLSDKPAAATQMCALVANPNHSVQPNSGNCVDLP